MMMENEDGEYGLSVMIENGGDDFLMEDEFSWRCFVSEIEVLMEELNFLRFVGQYVLGDDDFGLGVVRVRGVEGGESMGVCAMRDEVWPAKKGSVLCESILLGHEVNLWDDSLSGVLGDQRRKKMVRIG
ncbi:hypothetical protein V8G54_036327 [Vigna mungo]|uniref:Uncharacterized protein n=1 Tax=Vigna mungo TaxID=3915 RepID=A0AAQ3RCK9_VIGMU